MSKKCEWVYREIMHRVLEKGERFITQSSLSRSCAVSIGHVNKSIAPLEAINAIEKKTRGFRVLDPKKVLAYWSSRRNLRRDVSYQTFSPKPVGQIEREMPQVLFTGYSGFKQRFGHAPSDYSEVVVYADADAVRERFPPREGRPNVMVLRPDKHLLAFKEVPAGQLFVDLWNLGTWYAEDFLRALDAKIGDMTGGGRHGILE